MDLQAGRGAGGAGLATRVGDRHGVTATAVGDDRVAGLAGARAGRAVVAPGGLHREGASGRGEVERPARGPGRDPGALVAVLGAAGVGIAAGRVLVGDGLRVLVALDDGDAVLGPGAAGVDEARPAGGARVGDVGQVRERDVAVGGTHRAAAERAVAVVVVPGAESVGQPPVRVGAGRGDDDVLRVPVGGCGGVAEVAGGVDRLHAELVAGGRAR